MFRQFTDAARQVMVHANREAVNDGHENAGNLHILIAALTADPAILPTSAITLDECRKAVAELAANAPAANVKPAVENAMKSASGAVDVPHLVLGILSEPDECVTLFFQRVNADLEQVRSFLVAKL